MNFTRRKRKSRPAVTLRLSAVRIETELSVVQPARNEFVFEGLWRGGGGDGCNGGGGAAAAATATATATAKSSFEIITTAIECGGGVSGWWWRDLKELCQK